MNKKLSRAFISVSDKTGLIEFAKKLLECGVEIIASDGTALELEKFGINVKRVEEITGFAQLLDGKVKTLHPLIYAAVLADLDDANQLAELEKHKITPIDLVVVNFYESKKFDIGGPAIVRAAIKNAKHVIALTSPKQYSEVIDNLEIGFTQIQRDNWASTALQMVTNYDLDLLRDFGSTLRYGENPHQNAVVIGDSGVAGAQLISGKPMSYNNYLDADAAFSALLAHSMPTVVFVKHSNPCGLASASELSSAFTAALNCDPISAFGGVIAVNESLDIKTAKLIVENFYEVIIAPEFQEDALKLLETKKNLRVVKISKPTVHNSEVRQILGGFLFQEPDLVKASRDDFTSWRLVSGKPADDLQILDLNFAWRVVKSVKSNAVVLVKNLATVGIGMGQVNRVDAVKHAVERASLNAKGCIAASDGFFPFVDGIEELANAGVTTLVQPGGSIKDEELIEFCNKNNLTMYFTGTRHFLH